MRARLNKFQRQGLRTMTKLKGKGGGGGGFGVGGGGRVLCLKIKKPKLGEMTRQAP